MLISVLPLNTGDLLCDALDMDNFLFSFSFILFSNFIGILFSFSFSFSDNEEAHDIAVT